MFNMKNTKNLVNWLKRNNYAFEQYKEVEGCQGIIIGHIEIATENDDLIVLYPNGDYEQMTNREVYKMIKKEI